MLLRISNQRANAHKNTEEQEVKHSELDDVSKSVAGLILGILLKGDKAGERGDKSAYATDVYTKQKIAVIKSKLREKYRRWNVTDDLTGERREYECVHLKE